MKKAFFHTSVAVAILFVCCAANAGEFRNRFSTTVRQPFPWSATRTLDISEAGGDIVVNGLECSEKKEPARFESSGNSCTLINVKGVKTCYFADIKDARSCSYNVMMMSEGRADSYKVRTKLSGMMKAGMSGEIDYSVMSPVMTPLKLETITGLIDVRSIGADISATTVSGDITINRATGTVSAETVTGGISISGSPSSGTARTLTGAIKIKVNSGKDFHIEATTVTGPVRIELPSGFAGRIEAVTAAGRIDYERAALDKVMTDGHKMICGKGDGDAVVFIKTVSGNVTITSPEKKD